MFQCIYFTLVIHWLMLRVNEGEMSNNGKPNELKINSFILTARRRKKCREVKCVTVCRTQVFVTIHCVWKSNRTMLRFPHGGVPKFCQSWISLALNIQPMHVLVISCSIGLDGSRIQYKSLLESGSSNSAQDLKNTSSHHHHRKNECIPNGKVWLSRNQKVDLGQLSGVEFGRLPLWHEYYDPCI